MEARDYYREAIIYVEDLVDARRKERNDLLMPLYSNLAQADRSVTSQPLRPPPGQVYLRLEEPSSAEEVCILPGRSIPNWPLQPKSSLRHLKTYRNQA